MTRTLIDLRRATRRSRVGGKAAGLARLARLGFAVPPTWVVPHSVTTAPHEAEVSAALAQRLEPGARYAVRSSALAEDGDDLSYAGRFVTVLDVPAADVPAAVAEVAASTGGTAGEYAQAMGGSAGEHACSVIVQQMIDPVVAGVVFSRNPVTGVHETVIEAVHGTAEDLVGGRRPPERWVRRHDEWLLTPDEPDLPADVAIEIAEGAGKLEAAWGRPVDAEWAWDGTLWWLQVRPITAGASAAVYSSRMARDMLPGLITPLVWSVNGPLKTRMVTRFLENVFGPLGIDPNELATLFHYRCYINVGALGRLTAEFGLPEESLEVLAGMQPGATMPSMPRPTMKVLRRAPQMGSAAWQYSRFDRQLERELPVLWTRSRSLRRRDRGDETTLAGSGARARRRALPHRRRGGLPALRHAHSHADVHAARAHAPGAQGRPAEGRVARAAVRRRRCLQREPCARADVRAACRATRACSRARLRR